MTAGRASGLEESPDTAGQDAGVSQAAKADGKWNRKNTAGLRAGKGETVGQEPTSVAATRRLAKPRPVQGEQAPSKRPAEEPGSRTEGWSPATESGLQACYGKNPAFAGFSY